VKHDLLPLDDLPRGAMVAVRAGKTPVLVVRTEDDALYALRDVCPHRAAPLSKGAFFHAMTADQPGHYALSDAMVVKCPWHGYEFDVTTGACTGDPERTRVRVFKAWTEGGRIYVETK
jgi:nitrite reductase (NADH) small subunit